jgi:hypothetical protein
MRKTLEDERDAVDLITDCMYSARFLHDIGEVIFSHGADKISVGNFYHFWLKISVPLDSSFRSTWALLSAFSMLESSSLKKIGSSCCLTTL